MSFITSPGVIVPPLTAGGVAYGTGGQAKVNSAGTAGQFLQSAGAGVPIWADAGAVIRVPRTSNTVLVKTNNSSLIAYTSGTFTQTFTAAATLGSGWFVYLQNAGTGVITLNPDGAELIDGLTSYAMYPGECRLVQCTGTEFFSVVLSPFSVSFTSSSTFITPPGYSLLGVRMWGGGAGGNGGAAQSAGINRNGGGAGGAGGQNFGNIIAPAAGTSITATIGAGGLGLPSETFNTSPGGTTTLVGYMSAYGGNNNTNYINGPGGGGGSLGSAGDANGGSPRYLLFYDTSLIINSTGSFGFGGANGSNASSTATAGGALQSVGCSEHGGSGGGGGAAAANENSYSGGKSITGATGGGQGGGASSGNVLRLAGAGGGVGYQLLVGSAFVAGTGMGGGAAAGVGSAGAAGVVLASGSGGGGGGGAGALVGSGFNGGAGATPGGGGGGGGGGQPYPSGGGTGGNGGGGQINIFGIA